MATIQNGKGVYALGAFDLKAELKCFEIGRPKAGPDDVEVEIKYCGMCHSDCHACNGDWGLNFFPIAPGHEIAGTVKAVGENVSKFKVGDNVGVGCMVMSCKSCDMCQAGLEQYCFNMTQTYGSKYPAATAGKTFKEAVGYHTNGGYSSAITVDQHFVFSIPSTMKMEYAGVLLCAGITTFSPLNRHVLQKGGGKGKSVGILGFGGLGQMAAKIAKAMGVDEVTILSRSDKKKDAAARLGCEYMVYTDDEVVAKYGRHFDLVLDTVSAPHNVSRLINTMKVSGTWVLLGAIGQPFDTVPFQLIMGRYAIEGSLIGGIPETQEMLDFCAAHNIVPEYQVIKAAEANAQFQALMNGTADADRKVIDMASINDVPVVSSD